MSFNLFSVIASTACVAVVVLLLSLSRPSFHAACNKAMEFYRPNVLDGLYQFIDNLLSSDAEFWQASQGLRGVTRRMVNALVLLRVVQVHYAFGLITAEEALDVAQQACALAWLSFLSYPEAAWCAIWKRLPHANARYALEAYANLAALASGITYTKYAQSSILELKDSL